MDATDLNVLGDPTKRILYDEQGAPRDSVQTFSVYVKTGLLIGSLQSNASFVSAFNLLFGANVPTSGILPSASLQILFDLTGNSAYVQADFLAALPKAASLHGALTASLRLNFEKLFGIPVVNQVTSNAVYRKALFDISGEAGYSQTSFLNVLPGAASLYSVLQGNSSRRQSANLLFGTSFQSTGDLAAANRSVLFDIAGGPGYQESDFLPALDRTASLYQALQQNSSLRADFNLIFGSTVAGSGTPSVTDRTRLFNTAGDPNFNLGAFSTVLPKAAGLYRALQTNVSKLFSFNSRFGTNLPAVGSPTSGPDIGKLFDITGDPNFNLNAFLESL